LVVLRDVEKEYEEVGLRKQHHHRFKVKLYLANQTAELREVAVTERLPVSEIEQVEILVDEKETDPGFARDAQGLVTWKVSLAPGAERRLRLAFTVKTPSNVRWSGA
jgi:hypothetical protein